MLANRVSSEDSVARLVDCASPIHVLLRSSDRPPVTNGAETRETCGARRAPFFGDNPREPCEGCFEGRTECTPACMTTRAAKGTTSAPIAPPPRPHRGHGDGEFDSALGIAV